MAIHAMLMVFFSFSRTLKIWNFTKNLENGMFAISDIGRRFLTNNKSNSSQQFYQSFYPSKLKFGKINHDLGILVVFCFQNCSDLLWEKIVLLSLLKADLIKSDICCSTLFWLNWRSCTTLFSKWIDFLFKQWKVSTIFETADAFLTCSWRFLRSRSDEVRMHLWNHQFSKIPPNFFDRYLPWKFI